MQTLRPKYAVLLFIMDKQNTLVIRCLAKFIINVNKLRIYFVIATKVQPGWSTKQCVFTSLLILLLYYSFISLFTVNFTLVASYFILLISLFASLNQGDGNQTNNWFFAHAQIAGRHNNNNGRRVRRSVVTSRWPYSYVVYWTRKLSRPYRFATLHLRQWGHSSYAFIN